MTGLDRMLYMSATSDSSGSAAVTLTFAPGTDPDLAWAKVQNKLQLAMPMLPDVVQSTGVTVSKSTRNYLMIVGLTSDDGSVDAGGPARLRGLEARDGPRAACRASARWRSSARGYAMRIWLDPDKLTKYGMTRRRGRGGAHLQRGGLGRPVRRRAGRPGPAPERLDPRPVAAGDARGVRGHPAAHQRRRLGRAGLGRRPDGARHRASTTSRAASTASRRRHARHPAGGRAPTRSTPPTASRPRWTSCRGYFPPGMKVVYPYDTTPFVEVAIYEVVKTLFEAIVLVFLVMYLFLGNLRATLIPTIAVPVVILGHLRRPRRARLLDQHADDVRHGARHRPARRRRHRRGRERRARDERGGAVRRGRRPGSRWTRSPARWSASASSSRRSSAR